MWPPSSAAPKWERVEVGNWIELLRCPGCDRLWCAVPYEPYGSFPYSVLWLRTIEEWRQLHEYDDEALTLHRWHQARVQMLRSRMNKQDKRAVAWHRERSYGRTPFDEKKVELPDLALILGAA